MRYQLIVLTLLSACGPLSPPVEPGPVGPSSLTVVSLNIAGGAGAGAWRSPEARALQAEFLSAQAADVLCLQEVDVGTARNFGANAMEVLPSSGSRIFGRSISFEGGDFGNGLWFRDGIEVLDVSAHAFEGTPETQAGTSLEVEVEIDQAVRTRVVCTHLHWMPEFARVQAVELRSRLEGVSILLGDMNLAEPEPAPDFAPLTRLTIPGEAAWDEIDQVWSSYPGTGEMIPTDGASDHPFAARAVLTLLR